MDWAADEIICSKRKKAAEAANMWNEEKPSLLYMLKEQKKRGMGSVKMTVRPDAHVSIVSKLHSPHRLICILLLPANRATWLSEACDLHLEPLRSSPAIMPCAWRCPLYSSCGSVVYITDARCPSWSVINLRCFIKQSWVNPVLGRHKIYYPHHDSSWGCEKYPGLNDVRSSLLDCPCSPSGFLTPPGVLGLFPLLYHMF